MSRSLTRSVAINWFGLGARILSGFFLLPFILGHVGEAPYGIYLVLVSVFGYGALLDLGLAAVVTRYVSSLRASGEHQRLSRLLSVVFSFYGSLCLLLLAVAAAIFLLPAEWFPEAESQSHLHVLVFLALARTAFWFPQMGWISVLRACERFDLSNLIDVVTLAIRVTFIVTLVPRGGGIAIVLVADLLEVMLSLVLHALVCRRLFPEIRPMPMGFSREELRTVTSYGSWVILNSLAYQIRYRSHSLVIGGLLSAEAVTIFGMPGRLQSYMVNVTNVMTTPVRARIGALEGQQMWDAIHALYLRSLRLVSLVALALTTCMFLEARDFFAAWVGPQYELPAPIMRILLPSIFFDMTMTVSIVTVYAVGRHARMSRLLLGEAIAMVVGSVLVARPFGLLGVAVANAAPVLLVRAVLLPRYAASTIDLPHSRWVRESLGPVLATGVLAIPLLVGLRWLWSSGSLIVVVTRMMIELGILGAVAWRIALQPQDREIGVRILRKIRGGSPA